MKKNMRDEIYEVIEQVVVAENEEKKAVEQKYKGITDRFRKAVKLLDKYKGKKSFTDKQLKEIQNITCFGGLGFCCGLSKQCYFRDTALHILGISKKQFKKKEKWDKCIRCISKQQRSSTKPFGTIV